MFDLFGYLIKGFVLFWLTIIGSVPQMFMGALTLCVVATVLTYFLKKSKAEK